MRLLSHSDPTSSTCSLTGWVHDAWCHLCKRRRNKSQLVQHVCCILVIALWLLRQTRVELQLKGTWLYVLLWILLYLCFYLLALAWSFGTSRLLWVTAFRKQEFLIIAPKASFFTILSFRGDWTASAAMKTPQSTFEDDCWLLNNSVWLRYHLCSVHRPLPIVLLWTAWVTWKQLSQTTSICIWTPMHFARVSL